VKAASARIGRRPRRTGAADASRRSSCSFNRFPVDRPCSGMVRQLRRATQPGRFRFLGRWTAVASRLAGSGRSDGASSRDHARVPAQRIDGLLQPSHQLPVLVPGVLKRARSIEVGKSWREPMASFRAEEPSAVQQLPAGRGRVLADQLRRPGDSGSCREVCPSSVQVGFVVGAGINHQRSPDSWQGEWRWSACVEGELEDFHAWSGKADRATPPHSAWITPKVFRGDRRHWVMRQAPSRPAKGQWPGERLHRPAWAVVASPGKRPSRSLKGAEMVEAQPIKEAWSWRARRPSPQRKPPADAATAIHRRAHELAAGPESSRVEHRFG